MDTVLEKELEKIDLLRFTTAGSVDDGKSTLIGRLLYDSKSIYEDQLDAVSKTSSKRGHDGIDFALLTDGLKAEREQGITIDVAYRYFSTPKRKFIIADTPGHEQYTRNMVTGASTADLAVILIDASKGISPQSRRHAFISNLLGIPDMVIAVNKMDLIEYSEEKFNAIVSEFKEFAKDFNLKNIHFVPMSALVGRNVVAKDTEDMPWYQGPCLLEILESTDVTDSINAEDFRLPVQYVIRPDQTFRGFAGQIVSGSLNVGDQVTSLPSGKSSKVKSINIYDKELQHAFAPSSVTLTLEDEIDTSRGDVFVKSGDNPEMKSEFDADLCWMAEEPLQIGKKYLIKHSSSQLKSMIKSIDFKFNVTESSTVAKEDAQELNLNELGRVKIKTLKSLLVDEYSRNRATGSFIIIDELTNNTVAAGMIVG